MLKILQARLQQYVKHEPPDVQAGFRKGKEPEIKLPASISATLLRATPPRRCPASPAFSPHDSQGWTLPTNHDLVGFSPGEVILVLGPPAVSSRDSRGDGGDGHEVEVACRLLYLGVALTG